MTRRVPEAFQASTFLYSGAFLVSHGFYLAFSVGFSYRRKMSD
jgi:hypothetical protein